MKIVVPLLGSFGIRIQAAVYKVYKTQIPTTPIIRKNFTSGYSLDSTKNDYTEDLRGKIQRL